MLRRQLLFSLLLLLPALLQAETLRVAAAASLSHALPEIARGFEQASGHRVKLSFGSSGNLSRQIRQGAPFELFLGADEAYADDLSADGFGVGESRVYARGELALFAPGRSVVAVSAGLAGIGQLLDAEQLRRFAIASPEHAPYGRMARAALERAGLWTRIEGKLVTGENAAQTAQFATTGAVDAALIPRSLAELPAVARRGTAQVLPATQAPALRQRMLLLVKSGTAAREFFAYLLGEPARAVLIRHGFVAP